MIINIFWNNKERTPLTDDQKRAFEWVIKLFKKERKDLNDAELEVQKIYKNVIIF